MKFLENINSRTGSFKGVFRFDEPMSAHTSFKTGGPADLWIRPLGDDFPEFAAILLESAKNEGIPVFILGSGANIVVSDDGIRGIVLDVTGYSGLTQKNKNILGFKAGTSVTEATEYAANNGFSGLEFLFGMPGSIGGALWMNARSYNREVSDVINEVQFLEDGREQIVCPDKNLFGYKKSPFQEKKCLIISVSFTLQEKDNFLIKKEMAEYRNDRELKGHYRFPSAGSVFKNNKSFGKPTGKIIDELGLKGMTFGGAQIAPWHGNIIINQGTACSGDILSLVQFMENRVKTELGFTLEREIIFIGKFKNN